MYALLDIEEGASEEELANAYKGKRQRYLKEIKSTSAKPRIRLLKDKLERLESAYKAYTSQISDSSMCVERSITAETTKNAESGVHKRKTKKSSPGSHRFNRIYPIITVEGMLISKEAKETFSFWVNGRLTRLNEDESIEVPKDFNQIRIEHPGIKVWEQSFKQLFTNAMPLPINLIPLKSKFSLSVSPKVSFRLFVDGVEHPRTLNDMYELAVFQPKSISLQAEGYEDRNFHLEHSKDEQRIEFELFPKPEYCDLVTGETPFSVKHEETKDEIYFVAGDDFILGRATDAKVPLCGRFGEGCDPEHLFISRKHFSIRKEKKKVILIDHSSNGTFLNGKKIIGEQELTAGMVHELGIFNPHKEKFVLRKSLFIEASEPSSGNEYGEPLFVSLGDLAPVKKRTTELLLFKVCSRMRDEPDLRVEFLKKILPFLSSQTGSPSLSSFSDEVGLWKINNLKV